MQDIHTKIREDIEQHPVLLYMKGTAAAPQCGFSAFVCAVLKKCGVVFEARNVLADETLRQEIKTYSKWPTIPQLYIKGQFIGGCDIVKDMYEKGTFQDLIREKGLQVSTQGM